MPHIKLLIVKRQILAVLIILAITANIKISAEENVWHQINIPTQSINAIETTPLGVLAGEFSIFIPNAVTNGLFITKDLGNTWQEFGLINRGVTDLRYYNGTLYAATYFSNDNGQRLYISTDNGLTWQNTGPVAAGRQVDRDESMIYYGTYSFGLWTSTDNGNTWIRADNAWDTTDDIYMIESGKNSTLVATNNNTYITADNGISWQKVTFLNNKKIRSALITQEYILAGSDEKHGLYISYDNGNTWSELGFFNGYYIGNIKKLDTRLFVARKNNGFENLATIFMSTDNGTTWVDTNLHIQAIKNASRMAITYGKQNSLFAFISSGGLYKMDLPKYSVTFNRFLDIPFDYDADAELMTKITSFFDHQYPLLGYKTHEEPDEAKQTTVNFFNQIGYIPNIFYSTHNGIDFKLPYGSPVKAAAPGYASYYFCNDCGNTIKINHQNGYESVYMHLKSDGLVTTGTNKVWINKGDTLGYVGMSGNTSGPHLHFTVNKTTKQFPDSLVDPYGWLDNSTKDPWEIYTWSDKSGNHQGSASDYLWKNDLPELSAYLFNPGKTVLISNNKTIEYQKYTSTPETLKLIESYIPLDKLYPTNHTYIHNTALDIKLINLLNEEIHLLQNSVSIVYNLHELDLTNINIDTLKVLWYDDISCIWLPVTTVLDLTEYTLTGITNHLSQFAVFAEKLDPEPPVTQIDIIGEYTNDWYTTYPSVKLTSNKPYETFISVNQTHDMSRYDKEISFDKNGIYEVFYRSRDTNDNLEDTKTHIIKVKVHGFTNKIKAKQVTFSVRSD